MNFWAQSYEITMDMLRHDFTAQVLYMMFGLGFGGWVAYWV